jgi:hypothetical protein
MTGKIMFRVTWGIRASKNHSEYGSMAGINNFLLTMQSKYGGLPFGHSFFYEKGNHLMSFPIIGLSVYGTQNIIESSCGFQSVFDIEEIEKKIKETKEKLTPDIEGEIQKFLKTKDGPDLYYCVYCEDKK